MKIRPLPTLFVLCVLMAIPAMGDTQPTCVAPVLSEQQIKDLIAKERTTRKDLPPPFAESRTVLRRHGCHYTYIEYGIPQRPDEQNIFKLNQHGVIVDVDPGSLACPAKVFTEAELTAIVKNARAARKDLPPAFKDSRTRIERVRCLYQFFEYAVPEARGNFQVFTIDPLGEVMDIHRSKPY